MSLSRYSKTIAAVVAAVISWATVVTQSASAPITSAEWVAGAVLVAGALGVYQVTNSPADAPKDAGAITLLMACVLIATAILVMWAVGWIPLDVNHN